MEIRVHTGKMDAASSDLLDLSRKVRQLRQEVEDVTRRLRSHSQLETCRGELQKQTEALELLTARLVSLSAAAGQISQVYRTGEDRNLDRLEEQEGTRRTIGEVAMYGVSDQYRNKIQQILYK